MSITQVGDGVFADPESVAIGSGTPTPLNYIITGVALDEDNNVLIFFRPNTFSALTYNVVVYDEDLAVPEGGGQFNVNEVGDTFGQDNAQHSFGVCKYAARRSQYQSSDLTAAFSTDDTTPIRLIPFEYATADAYVLGFGHGFVSFFKNGAQVQF